MKARGDDFPISTPRLKFHYTQSGYQSMITFGHTFLLLFLLLQSGHTASCLRPPRTFIININTRHYPISRRFSRAAHSIRAMLPRRERERDNAEPEATAADCV